MATNYISQGRTMDYAATADITSGEIVVVGNVVGIAAAHAANGSEVTLLTHGEFELPKTAGAIAQGVKVYLTSGGNITTTASGNTAAGIAWAAAASADTTVYVKINV